MGRPKGSKNKTQTGISYPRKCDFCSHMANNPSSYHYHKQVHFEIPEGTLCDNGCGNVATVIKTNGRYKCQSNAHLCPEYIKNHSDQIKKQWADESSNDRREKFRQLFADRMADPKIYKKSSITKREKFGTLDPERAKDFRHYARFVRQRAQTWAKANGYDIGRDTFHVDHILSINDAWKAGLPEPVVNHPVNLRILECKLNSGKGSKSLFSVQELLSRIEQYNKGNIQ